MVPSQTVLRVCSFGWFSFVFFGNIKTAIINTMLSVNSICFSSELSNPRVVIGAPKSVASWSEMRVALWTPNLQLVSEEKTNVEVWRTVPLTLSLASLRVVIGVSLCKRD